MGIKRRSIEQVLKTVRNYEMIEPGQSVMVAVSGGPDSVFLLEAMLSLKNKLKIREITVCNLDHGMRPGASAKDSLFVKRYAEKKEIRLFQKRIALRSRTRVGVSMEEAARKARYGFFFDSARQAGADIIATGHTLDDQAETVLMRIVKGASLKGLIGVPPVREEGCFKIIRPIMELEKKVILMCLKDESIDYRVDSSNAETIYFRNAVRNEIIPYLEKFNPRIKRALFNMAEHLREDFNFIDQAREAAGHAMILGTQPSCLRIEIKDLVIQPRAIQKEIIRDAFAKAGGSVKRLSFRHWKECESLIRSKASGNSLDLPGPIRLTRDGIFLYFKRI